MATTPTALPAAGTSAVDRHLRGATNEIMGAVPGNVVINQGDLVILEMVSDIAQQGSATYKAYPASWSRRAGVTGFAYGFAGVAMNSSKSGTTEDIAIATTGIFRFPVTAAAGQTVLTGYIVSGATFGASGASCFTQKVVAGPAAGFTVNSGRIGMVIRGQTTSTTCDFLLMGSKFSNVSTYTWAA